MKNIYLIIGLSIILFSCKEESKVVIENNIRTEYYGNNNVKSLVKMKGDLEHGVYQEYYENNILKSTGVKIKGKKNGVWKNFSTDNKLTEVNYFYNDSLYYSLDKNDFIFSIKNVTNNIKIKMPFHWERHQTDNERALFISKKKCIDSLSFCPIITLTYENVGSSNINEYLEKNITLLSDYMPSYRKIKEREFEVNKNKAYELTYIATVNGIKIGALTTWVFHEDKCYIITGMSTNELNNEFLKYEGLFKEISSSLMIN